MQDKKHEELSADIKAWKRAFGSELLVLAHHYQRPEIVALADECGDSFQLAQIAASRPEAEMIVFCGVRFMSEAARILAGPEQQVFIPDPSAGCPMADMAELPQVERAWASLASLAPGKRLIPLAYMNSSSEIKAFCGRNGGAICTSSNAERALRWALDEGDLVVFFPDQHLGGNTARAMGLTPKEVLPWRHDLEAGGVDPAALAKAKILLWDGYCHVHTWFTAAQVAEARENFPGSRILVHPECDRSVVDLADDTGSTSFLVSAVRDAKPGDTLVIGTEINLVTRLQTEYPDRRVVPLSPSLCPNMYKTSLRDLHAEIGALPTGRHTVHVDARVAADARVALERMLALPG